MAIPPGEEPRPLRDCFAEPVRRPVGSQWRRV